jgi:hypothetical protein
MGILSDIFSKIFPSRGAAQQGTPSATQGGLGRTAGTTAAGAGSAAPVGASAGPAGIQSTPQPSTPVPMPQQAVPMDHVDVAAMLDNMASNAGRPLNWRTSIVDLLKLLDIDSSLEARKELARELDFRGDTGDSAAMNIWLHRQVMNRLAASGGKVPAELRD